MVSRAFLICSLYAMLMSVFPAVTSAQSSCDGLLSAMQQVRCYFSSGDVSHTLKAMEDMPSDQRAQNWDELVSILRKFHLEGGEDVSLPLADLLIDGPDEDRVIALDLYLDAASYSAYAMHQAGLLYCSRVIEHSGIECVFWLRAAAERGHVSSLLDLARVLIEQYGDLDSAILYLEKAKDLGVPEAQQALDILNRRSL